MKGGQALEYLSQVLSQRGPQAVPYEEGAKWRIREHVSELLKMFPHLKVEVSEFHANNGRILNLIKAEGTIPIHYQGAKYNIPILIWLPERYPTQAPLVYVTPTSNMIVKIGHSFVDPSGLVHSPYLSHWMPNSDLSSTCQEMAMLFGAEPPLYTKPANYVPPPGAAGYPGSGPSSSGPSSNPYAAYGQQPQVLPQQQPQVLPQQQQQQQQQPLAAQQQPPAGLQQQQAGGQPGGFFARPPPDPVLAGQALWGGAYSAAAAATSGSNSRLPDSPGVAAAAAGGQRLPSPYGAAGGPPPDPKQLQVDAIQQKFQGLASRALAGRLQAGLEAYNRHATEEMDSLLEVQRNLTARERQLQGVVASIQQERQGTEGLVAELGKQSAALEAWLASHEWKADAVSAVLAQGSSEAGALDINKVIVPADDLSRQALMAQAEDLAVEDCLLVLEKALLQGKLTPEAYMKQVRLLCRRQFLARALGLKVAQAQRQQQRVSGGSTTQQQGQQHQQQQQSSPYTLTHGDMWTH